jgi:hypothetical protein
VLAALFFIVAILATATAIFQIGVRLGAFGLVLRDVTVRNPHVASNVVLTAILWIMVFPGRSVTPRRLNF